MSDKPTEHAKNPPTQASKKTNSAPVGSNEKGEKHSTQDGPGQTPKLAEDDMDFMQTFDPSVTSKWGFGTKDQE